MKINFKNILFFVLVLFGISIVVQMGRNMAGAKSDYCLEDGDCKEGRVIYIDNNKIFINEESCVQNNWQWYKKSNICKITNIQFKVEEVIYE